MEHNVITFACALVTLLCHQLSDVKELSEHIVAPDGHGVGCTDYPMLSTMTKGR